MVVLPVHLDQMRFKVCADAAEDLAQSFDGSFIEDLAAVLSDEDQMNMHFEDTVSTVPDVIVIAHRPKYIWNMERRQAFQFELLPDGGQQRLMHRFAGSSRFVFNKALALQKERYEQGANNLGYAAPCKQLSRWRNGATAWLAESPVHPLQQSPKSLERVYAALWNVKGRKVDPAGYHAAPHGPASGLATPFPA